VKLTGIETLGYREFGDRLRAMHRGSRTPVQVSIEISFRCPLSCVHCCNNLPIGDAAAKRGEMTFEEHQRLLDQLVEAGTLWLLYTGGEIFARPDFLDIYREAKRKGFIVTLFTNGTLVTPRVADVLADYRPFSVEITLYGATRETYEAVTRVPGSFDACWRGIRLLRQRGIQVELKAMALRQNVHELAELKRIVAEEMGVALRFDPIVTPRYDCSQTPIASRLSPAEIVALDLEDAKRMEEWHRFGSCFVGQAETAPRGETIYECGGGVGSFSVDPEGMMRLCSSSRLEGYDLKRGTVGDGWTRFMREVRARPVVRRGKCTLCSLKSLCGMCPANAELEAGDPETPVDFLCRVAHLRAAAFGWDTAEHGECEYCPGGSRREEFLEMLANLEGVDSTRKDQRPKGLALPSLPG
jgi:radical SAM protein with 4Fe4S-binding SPASM domain